MKKLILLFSTVFSLNFAFADSGIWEYYMQVNVNGTISKYGSYSGGASFDGADLGLVTPSSGGSVNLSLNGIKTWKNGLSDVYNAYMYYRIYKQGTTAGTFEFHNLPFYQNLNGTPGDQDWQYGAPGINITPQFTSMGTWVVEVYYMINSSDGQRYFSNLGANYKATIQVGVVTPVKFSSFTAKALNTTAQLNWQTASELNTKQFNVERSANGVDFATIATVGAKGNSANLQNYVYTDNSPLSGISYYRVAAIDFDGKTIYSDVRRVEIKNNRFALLSNITNNEIRFKNSVANENLKVLDMNGRIVVALAKFNGNALCIGNLPAGVYVLTNGTESHRIIKQ